jgi:hypothetical protein
LALPAAVQATPTFTISASLNPGDHYRVVFVTSNFTRATDSAIATYNTFVTSDAALNSSLPTATWMAIASTASVDAINNIACTPSCAGDPIFLVDGTKVANSTSGLFSPPILTAINLTESDTSSGSNYAWTGSNSDGTVFTGFGLGSNSPEYGDVSVSNANWIHFDNIAQTATEALYAISSDLVVPGSIPAPTGAPLFALGGLLTFVARWSRGRQRPAR